MPLQEEELTEAEKQFKAERGGGNYGAGTKEMQVRAGMGCRGGGEGGGVTRGAGSLR